MDRVFNNILDAVGNTPIVRLNRVGKDVKPTLWAKCEFMNPGSSVKDRIAAYIVAKAERTGALKPGGTIIEATSGNTGMGLALAAAVKGYQTIFVMPDKMSDEKIKSLRAFGSRVVITPTAVGPEDPRSYYSVAKRLAEETPNSFYSNQYHNPDNPEAHYYTTGPEIWKQLDGKIDAFVACLGTGGTISGCAKYFKEQNHKVKVIGVDPVGSLYYDYFKTGKLTEAFSYLVEGFGEDFLPGTMDFKFIDDVVRVNDKECFHTTRQLVQKEGLYAGGSSGAAVRGALKWAQSIQENLNILVLLPDHGTRYLSKIFDDTWMRENGMFDEDVQGRVTDILASKSDRILTAEPAQSIRHVVGLMREYGISQLPVLDQGKLSGIIEEGEILSGLSGGKCNVDSPIRELISTAFSVVPADTSIKSLTQLFQHSKVAIVMEKNVIKNVVTKIDLIEYLSGNLRNK